jgi:hypothetical protein
MSGRPSDDRQRRELGDPRPVASTNSDEDPTVVAVGTSLTWCTGNAYQFKYPDLVNRDLTGDYPIHEKYLHYDGGNGEMGANGNPEPAYYERTIEDGYSGGGHPNGDHIPPVQYRARGGAIIGLSEPYRRVKGKPWHEIETNDAGNYLSGGDYYGKLDHIDDYRNLFDETDINTSAWTITRDIGWHWPTIVDQVRQFPDPGDPTPSLDVPTGSLGRFGNQAPDDEPPAGEDVDLVILDGGTNDIELGWLNNPSEAGRTHIWRAVKRHMYDDMTGQNGLLRRARRKFPNAVIVLVGEPAYASNRTDHSTARSFLVQSSWVAAIYPGVVEQSLDNAVNFAHMAPYWLRRSVAEEAWQDDGPGIVFAPPGYGVVNSMLADWPWSWGFVPNGGDGYSPDDTVGLRRQVCDAEDRREPGTRPGGARGDDDDEIVIPSCPAAGIGHPNHEGCRQYADAIVRRYKEHVDRSLGTVASELTGSGPTSLKRAISRHGFDPGSEGVRRPAEHRTVDSIKLKFWTDGGTGMGVRTGKVYLKVYPGRTGQGELFRLDSEDNDLRPNGPRNAGTDYPDDEFHVAPMLGRRLRGPPGNIDSNEVGVSGVDERTRQTFLGGDDVWNDRPLRLGDVKHATLVLDGVDPNDGWGLDRVRISINGHVSRTTDMVGRNNKNFRSDDGNNRPFSTREFLIASFNQDPDDTVGQSLDVTIPEDSVSVSVSGGVANFDFDVVVENPTSDFYPEIGIDYRVEVKNVGGNFTGRDNQFEPLGSFAPGQRRRRSLSLSSDDPVNVQTNNDVRISTISEINRYTFGGEVTTTKNDS